MASQTTVSFIPTPPPTHVYVDSRTFSDSFETQQERTRKCSKNFECRHVAALESSMGVGCHSDTLIFWWNYFSPESWVSFPEGRGLSLCHPDALTLQGRRISIFLHASALNHKNILVANSSCTSGWRARQTRKRFGLFGCTKQLQLFNLQIQTESANRTRSLRKPASIETPLPQQRRTFGLCDILFQTPQNYTETDIWFTDCSRPFCTFQIDQRSDTWQLNNKKSSTLTVKHKLAQFTDFRFVLVSVIWHINSLAVSYKTRARTKQLSSHKVRITGQVESCVHRFSGISEQGNLICLLRFLNLNKSCRSTDSITAHWYSMITEQTRTTRRQRLKSVWSIETFAVDECVCPFKEKNIFLVMTHVE